MKKNKFKPLKLIIIILIIIVVITLSVLLINYLKKVSYTKKYKEYSQKITELKLSEFYSGGDANDYEYVTYGEAAGLCVYANTKRFRIEDLGYAPTFDGQNSSSITYLNEMAIETNIKLNEENNNKLISRIEVINILGQLKEKVLEKKLDTDVGRLTITRAHKLDEKRLAYLKDAVKSGVLENSGKVGEKDYIRRGELNKIICEYITKVNVLGTNFGTVVTDPEKLPSNASEYPFILEEYEKELYEAPLKTSLYGDPLSTPANIFGQMEYGIEKTVERVQKYTDLLLNVDYNNIDEEKLIEEYNSTMQYHLNDEEIRNYINYVKEHKLIIKGESKVLVPSIYHDGLIFRIRVKMDFEILEGDTKTNVLLGDGMFSQDTPKEYKSKNSYIVDAPIEYGINTIDFFTKLYTVQNNIVKEI